MAIILPGGSSLSTVGPGDVPIVAFLFKGNRYPHWRLAFSRQFIKVSVSKPNPLGLGCLGKSGFCLRKPNKR